MRFIKKFCMKNQKFNKFKKKNNKQQIGLRVTGLRVYMLKKTQRVTNIF